MTATDDAVAIHSTLPAEAVKARASGLTVSAETSYGGANQHLIRDVISLPSSDSLTLTVAIAKSVSHYSTAPSKSIFPPALKMSRAVRLIRIRVLLASIGVGFGAGTHPADEHRLNLHLLLAGRCLS